MLVGQYTWRVTPGKWEFATGPKLVPQEKILGFLDTELSKIKEEHERQKASKKYKSKVIERKVKKLLNDIELILKTNAFENDLSNKIMELKKEIENSFCWMVYTIKIGFLFN